MAKFIKKPVQIEAIQWNGQNVWADKENNKLIIDAYENGIIVFTDTNLYIKTLEGEMKAKKGDWIIKGINNEIYPCKPDIFKKTYDLVN